MMTSRAGHPATVHAATWRGVLMVLLLAAVVAAPVVRAACAIEHLARAADTATTASALADGAFSDGTSEPDDCSVEQAQDFAAPHDASTLIVGLTASPLPDAPALTYLPLALWQPAALHISATRQRPPSPYEPVSRRVRRLLI